VWLAFFERSVITSHKTRHFITSHQKWLSGCCSMELSNS
jgi:hypothetical protein